MYAYMDKQDALLTELGYSKIKFLIWMDLSVTFVQMYQEYVLVFLEQNQQKFQMYLQT